MTLRLRLTLFFSAFIAIILSAFAFSVYVLTERSLATTIEERAQQALAQVRRADPLDASVNVPGDIYVHVLLVALDALDVAALRSGGIDVLRRENPTPARLVPGMSDRALQELVQDGSVQTTVALQGGERVRVYGELTQVRVGAFSILGVILVGVPITTIALTLDGLARDLGFTVVLAFLAFAAGVWLLARQVLAPVQRVTQAAARVSSRDLSQRVPVPTSQDEMRELAVAINHMLDRLQESFETQRRFTADASHELRTPVTAIGGHANYLLRRTRPSNDQIDSLNVIRHEAERMGKLVNDLLELARADAGFSVEKQPLNLVEVVEAVRDEYMPVANGAEIVVDSLSPLVEVEGDAGRLKQVVLNLVQNAVNAGAMHVRVHLEKAGREVRLEVLDDGPGIPAEAIPHLFDRFFRVDGARSTRGNGSGLGLAIVRWIVQQHGGSVEVTSRPAEGSVFVVTLPALDPKLTAEVERQPRATLTDAVPVRR